MGCHSARLGGCGRRVSFSVPIGFWCASVAARVETVEHVRILTM